MEKQLDVFFDYMCPYCYKSHRYLTELLPNNPQIKIVWHPCESHPRPDPYGPHSDLCIQGYFFAVANGVDLMEYHERMYRAALIDHVDIENVDLLSAYISDLVDVDSYRSSLQQGIYRKALSEANELAFEKSGVWVVPAYRMERRKIDAVENIGVSKEQLRQFLDDVV